MMYAATGYVNLLSAKLVSMYMSTPRLLIIGASLSEPHTRERFFSVNHVWQKMDKNSCQLKYVVGRITA